MNRKPISDFPNYEITTDGLVFKLEHLKGKRIIPEKQVSVWKTKQGYWRCALCLDGKQKKELLHRLLAKTFINNELNLPQVNHKDGNKANCSIDNLEWVTNSRNIKHGYETGLIKRTGGNGVASKLSEAEVFTIKEALKIGVKTSVLGAFYNVTSDNIRKIRSGTTWSHVSLPL